MFETIFGLLALGITVVSGVLAFGLAAAILVVVPFLDRRANRDQPSPAFMALGLGALMYMIAFTIIGYFAA